MPLEYKIDQIICKAGSTPDSDSEPLTIDVGTVTILVGANHSGKSQFLKDIESKLPNLSKPRFVVDEITIHSPETVDGVVELLESTGSIINDGKVFVFPALKNPAGVEIRDRVRSRNLDGATNELAKVFCVHIDATARFNLLNSHQMRRLTEPSRSPLVKLFKDDVLREKLRSEIAKAFTNTYFVIDPTHGGNLGIRFSDTPPPSHESERSLGNDAIKFFQKADPVQNTSDGIKAYSALCLAVVAGIEKILLIDEPEAFLHPPLAKQLGYSMATLARDTNKQIISATHSVDFLMGCVESGVDVNIVRLTYARDTGDATARKLETEKINELMADPLLRSTATLRSVFYDGIVVVEGDNDRALYDEILFRLQKSKAVATNLGIQFINAQNKQTVHRIAKPLRQLGVPAAIIVDLDIIYDTQNVWRELLESGFISKKLKPTLDASRNTLKHSFQAFGDDYKDTVKEHGINALSEEDQVVANNLLTDLADYGIFLVPCGTLESWFAEGFKISRKHRNFAVQVFDKLGKRGTSEYVHPSNEGVWEFIIQVTDWINNPQRKGIPSN